MPPKLIRWGGGTKVRLICFLLLLLTIVAYVHLCFASENKTATSPDFMATDLDGRSFSLSQFQGQPVVLHITNIEIPLCRECEKSLRGQTEELARLKEIDPSANIITLNLRKNPYSKDGRSLAESWWKLNISWLWAEDLEPYPIGSKYVDYWNLRGGSSNPTILLIDKQGRVAWVYHVYRVGEGDVDGVQSADSLYKNLQDLRSSRRLGFAEEISAQEVSVAGMFLLGILTSLAPCSIALLIAVFSYVLAMRQKDEYLRKSTSTSLEGFLMGVAFTLGMGLVFFFIGMFVSQVGFFLRDSRLFDLGAGVLMILLGISNIKPLEEVLEPVVRLVRRGKNEEKSRDGLIQRAVETSVGLFKYSSLVGAFTLGIFFALGWAPCALSMVFPVLIWLASQDVAPLSGGMMLFFFGLGHGVPIIPISTFSRAVGGRIGDRYVSIGKYTTKLFGLLVMAVGVVYAARYFGYAFW
jgi:cytochrome c-type biogenesis protein